MTRKSNSLLLGVAAAVLVALAFPLIAAETKPGSAQDKGSAAPGAQNFAIEHEIGRRFRIDPNDLPGPKAGPIVTNRVLVVPFSEQTLNVPKGFTATPFATGLTNPRRLLVLPNGDVLVAEQGAGYLTLLREGARANGLPGHWLQFLDSVTPVE